MRGNLVAILIGVDNAEFIIQGADVRGPSRGPIAHLGPLGWTCIGVTGADTSRCNRSHIIHSFLSREVHQKAIPGCCDVNNFWKKFWEVESYGTKVTHPQVMTKEEKEDLEKVESLLTHTGSRYHVEDSPKLPCNREMAINRLERIENKDQAHFCAARVPKHH